MKAETPLLNTIGDMCFRVTAHVLSRLRRREINAELDRLKNLPKTRSYGEVTLVLGALFGLALLAAGFGLWGLTLYFLAAVVLLR